MTTLREYWLALAFLLALAVTGYIEISRLLVKLNSETVTQLRTRR